MAIIGMYLGLSGFSIVEDKIGETSCRVKMVSQVISYLNQPRNKDTKVLPLAKNLIMED